MLLTFTICHGNNVAAVTFIPRHAVYLIGGERPVVKWNLRETSENDEYDNDNINARKYFIYDCELFCTRRE